MYRYVMAKQGVHQTNNLRRISITLRPNSRFPVPISDGYSVYSALLSALEGVDSRVSKQIHDSQLGSLHNSGLQGVFGDSDRSYHKTVRPDETYALTLGIVDPADTDIFQALVNALVLEGDRIELSHGVLDAESFESENTTHKELLARADSLSDPTLDVSFETATCIEEVGEITTLFPHRASVFQSLLGKWNQSAPSEREIDLSRADIEGNVIEKPNPRAYDTHSVLVNRVENEAGETRNLFRQGFSGDCEYAFKGASDAVENAVTALGLFSEYSGVGSAVARGCGNVSVEASE